MKKTLLFLSLCVLSITLSFSQVFDSLTVVNSEYNIEDISWKGDLLFAALGEGGVMYSDDEGFTWNSTSVLPDAGFGQEAANSILIASNGDLIIGGNLNYNGSPFSGVVFRSSDNGSNWTFVAVEGIGGYQKCEKILELPNGDLMMQAGQDKLFVSSLSSSDWNQCTSPGGVIFGFEAIGNIIFTVTNPSTGTAGTWTSTDLGQSWWLYGGNGTPVSGGTVTTAPILNTTNYKYICIGGAYDLKGVFRSGINDTMWIETNNGIDNFGIYPVCMATDNQTIWMVYQDAGGGCYFTSTTDFANNWETPVMGMPQQGVGGPCIRNMMVFKSHLYTFANNSIYRIADVASPSSTGELEYKKNLIDVFPNPVSNMLNFKFREAFNKNGDWEIINIYGQVMNSGQISPRSNNSVSIKVDQLPKGYYLLKTNTDGKASVTNFLKN